MRSFRALGIVVIGLTSACSAGPAAPSSPTEILTPSGELSPTGLVTDAAMILTAQEEASLTAKLAGVQAETGHPFVVVSVPSLNGEDVATFTENLANRWGVGRENGNDGVVLLIAVKERRARIAIGRGLMAKLPEAYGQQIMDEQIIPFFRQGDLPGGINSGVDAIIAVLKAQSDRTEDRVLSSAV